MDGHSGTGPYRSKVSDFHLYFSRHLGVKQLDYNIANNYEKKAF